MVSGTGAPTVAAARDVLRAVWGYEDFRPGQRRIVVAVLRGRDVLALLPTGGGKSLGFQLPALLLDGTTVVVSPLISLMQDQVAALRRRGVAAAYLSSSQSPAVQDNVWNAWHEGRLRLLYVAPERMGQLVERRARVPVPLLAVDEAHCVSEWGHDFRPHYRALGRHRTALGGPPAIAVTATATPATRHDILRVLGLRRPVRVQQSFDRPNLRLIVKRFADERSRLVAAANLLRGYTGPAIVYVSTRNRTDGVTAVFRRWGLDAAPYHAGLPAGARRALLRRFVERRIDVMVATNAFGMGIDQPDVRHVIHLGIPTRPEAYYQEAGRAGRDGQPAQCRLYWLENDLRLTAGMAKGARRAGSAESRVQDEVRVQAFNAMRRYVRTRRCRRRVLLAYLGERIAECAGCDRCSPM